jgi:hypothetical protein
MSGATLRIITGRGIHSEEAMVPVVRPAVIAYLDRLQPPLPWLYDAGNDGCLVVQNADIITRETGSFS